MYKENHLTGRPCLMIPDFARAMLSKEPPSAAICSSSIVVMTDAASSELRIIFVASLAPPSPAYYIKTKKNYFASKWPSISYVSLVTQDKGFPKMQIQSI